MIAEPELQEYLDEIRREVCSRCVERPTGGPPCGPLGKPCGVELHLPRLVEAVREVHSEFMGPYLDSTHGKVCASCPFLHSEFCPCPMDQLTLLVVQAIEAVDERHPERAPAAAARPALPAVEPGVRPQPLPVPEPPEEDPLEEIIQACAMAAGSWTGCDWPVLLAPGGMNVQGWSAAEAEARAMQSVGSQERSDWAAVASWLEEVERRAEQAEAQAALALAAANAGDWSEAVRYARRAWALEFATGRPIRRAPAWQRFYQLIVARAARAPERRGTLILID
jgi:hypothetical protein